MFPSMLSSKRYTEISMIPSIIIVKVHGNFHVPFLIIFAKVNRNFLVPLHVIFVKGTWKFPYSFPFYLFFNFQETFFSSNVPNILVIKCVEHNLRKSKVTRKKNSEYLTGAPNDSFLLVHWKHFLGDTEYFLFPSHFGFRKCCVSLFLRKIA